MKPHYVDLYEYSALVPADQLHGSYQYVCHLKSDSFFNVKSNVMGTPHQKSEKFLLNNDPVQRDNWVLQGCRKKQAPGFIENYISTHIADILFHCSTTFSIEDACNQIETLCVSYPPKAEAVRIVQNLTVCLPSGTSETKLLFIVAVKKLLKNPQLIIYKQIIDKEAACSILDGLRNHRMKDLPPSCRNDIYSICETLCSIVFQNSAGLIQHLNMCYPFYDDSFVLKTLENKISSESFVATETTTLYVSSNELLCKLYKSSLESSSKEAEETIELLLGHMPLRMTLFIAENAIRETELQNTIYSKLNIRIEEALRDVKKNRSIKKVQELWQDLVDFGRENLQLKTKFEATLLSMLEFYHSTGTEELPGTMVDFIQKFSFFQEEDKMAKLVKIITDSNNPEILELFIILSDIPEIEKQYFSLNTEVFYTFCLRYVTGKTSYFGQRDKEFQVTVKRICKIWDLSLVKEKPELNEELVKIWRRTIDEFRADELMRQLQFIDKMSTKNKSLTRVFIEHLNVTFTKHIDRVKDLLGYFSQLKGDLVIETR